MSDPSSKEFPQQEGGLPAIAAGTLAALALLGLLYFLGGFGSPENRAFRDQCHQRELRATAHLAIGPDYDEIVLKCEHELRKLRTR
jgi:hypothetical protein